MCVEMEEVRREQVLTGREPVLLTIFFQYQDQSRKPKSEMRGGGLQGGFIKRFVG